MRTEELGAGISIKSGTAEEIRNAVNTVLSDTKYKKAAVKISESFKESGGAAEAREFMESIIK